MAQPTLTELQHDGGDALAAWPATDLPAAIALLERLPDGALARACAAIRGGREGREGPIAWQPLPEIKGTIAGALWAARAALRAHCADAQIVHTDNGWAIRDRAGTVLEVGAPPGRRPAPAHMPIWVATRHGAEWCSVDGLGETVLRAVGKECETLQHSAEEQS
jgi:hypothetical protein|nr:MAG TPA: hypothetical protein [Caudoviricetes sp.]